MGKEGTLESLTSWNPSEINDMGESPADESVQEDFLEEPENREKQLEEQSSKSVFDFEPLEVEEQKKQDSIEEEDGI